MAKHLVLGLTGPESIINPPWRRLYRGGDLILTVIACSPVPGSCAAVAERRSPSPRRLLPTYWPPVFYGPSARHAPFNATRFSQPDYQATNRSLSAACRDFRSIFRRASSMTRSHRESIANCQTSLHLVVTENNKYRSSGRLAQLLAFWAIQACLGNAVAIKLFSRQRHGWQAGNGSAACCASAMAGRLRCQPDSPDLHHLAMLDPQKLLIVDINVRAGTLFTSPAPSWPMPRA